MKTRSSRMVLSPIFVGLLAAFTAFGQGTSEYLTTKDSVGGVRLGMTISQAKGVYQDAEFNFNGEDGVINVSRSGKLVMMVTPETMDANGRQVEVGSSSKITGIKVIDPRYKTATGIYPGISIAAAEKLMGKIGRMTLSYGERETADFTNQPDGFRFEFKGTNGGTAGIYDVKYPDPREQFATRFNPGAYIYSIHVSGSSQTEATTPTDVTRDLAGSGWTYNYGGTAYQFDFGQTKIEKFSNGWWQGVTWSSIGTNQIRLKNPETGKEMTLTFDSPNSFTGTDWDGRTPVSGNRRGLVVPPTNAAQSFLITPDSVGGIRIGMTIGEIRKLLNSATFIRTEDEGRDSIEVKQGGVTLMYFFAARGDDNYNAPVSESTKITEILVMDPRYRTAEGIGVGTPISEIEKKYGKLKEILLYDYDESEHATFSHQPASFDFSVKLAGKSKEGSRVGIYGKDESSTKTYVPGSVVSTIALTSENKAESGDEAGSFLITKNSVGNIRLGMSIAEARSAMKGMAFERSSDGEGVALIAVKKGDDELMSLYANEEDPQKPINDSAKIANIEVWDPRFKTAAGVHPKMKLADVEKVLGKVKKIIKSEIESREYADFTTKADGFMFRLMGPDFEAGIYSQGKPETSRYVANTYIFSISIVQGPSPDVAEGLK